MTQTKKLAELGLSLLKAGDFEKRAFLETYTALSRTEAANVLGCRPRDLRLILKPDYHLNGRPKYRVSSVLKKQEELIERSARVDG